MTLFQWQLKQHLSSTFSKCFLFQKYQLKIRPCFLEIMCLLYLRCNFLHTFHLFTWPIFLESTYVQLTIYYPVQCWNTIFSIKQHVFHVIFHNWSVLTSSKCVLEVRYTKRKRFIFMWFKLGLPIDIYQFFFLATEKFLSINCFYCLCDLKLGFLPMSLLSINAFKEFDRIKHKSLTPLWWHIFLVQKWFAFKLYCEKFIFAFHF